MGGRYENRGLGKLREVAVISQNRQRHWVASKSTEYIHVTATDFRGLSNNRLFCPAPPRRIC